MKFTLSWLRTHLDTDADAAAVAERLTAIGLEVEGVTDPGAALAPFRIARVVEAGQHPNADRLRACTVDAGEGPLSVVCGAPNARTGMLAVFAPPGSVIPATGAVLKVGEIRGVQSAGMLLSRREMGLGEEHDGIVELPEDAPVGASYAAWAGLDDPVIEIAVTPNRGDALSVRGVARDLAASGLGRLRPWAAEPVPAAFPRPLTWRTSSARLPLGARPHDPRRAQRPLARVAAAPPALRRAAADQRAGGRHQLLHAGPRPPAARVRRRPRARRRAGRARRPRRRDPRRPERPHLRGGARRLRDRRRAGLVSIAGVMGGEGTGATADDHQRVRRVRAVRPRRASP